MTDYALEDDEFDGDAETRIVAVDALDVEHTEPSESELMVMFAGMVGGVSELFDQ